MRCRVIAVAPGVAVPVASAAQEFRSAPGTHQAAMRLGGVGGAMPGFAEGFGLTRKDGWQDTQTCMQPGGGALACARGPFD